MERRTLIEDIRRDATEDAIVKALEKHPERRTVTLPADIFRRYELDAACLGCSVDEMVALVLKLHCLRTRQQQKLIQMMREGQI